MPNAMILLYICDRITHKEKLSDVTFLSDSVEIEDDAFDSDYELNELKFPSSTRKLK